MSLQIDFGIAIQRLHKQRGLSQERLALEADIDRRYMKATLKDVVSIDAIIRDAYGYKKEIFEKRLDYLKNLADGIYYELGKVKGFKYKGGTLKVLAQKPKAEGAPLSFLIRHETSSGIIDIGFLDSISNGLHFVGKNRQRRYKCQLINVRLSKYYVLSRSIYP